MPCTGVATARVRGPHTSQVMLWMPMVRAMAAMHPPMRSPWKRRKTSTSRTQPMTPTATIAAAAETQ